MDEIRGSAAAAALESRTHIVVLFSDLSDSTELSGAMEAETYAAMLGEVRRAFAAAVEARGGTVNQYQGDGLQALFGHPQPTEHDVRHAVDAVLEVHRQVRTLRERYRQEGAAALSVHSGIHAGLALARPGDDVAGRIELFGPAPGIAKHLSDIAQADEILVTDETLGPVGPLFDTGEPRRIVVKGRGDPLVVRRVLSRSVGRTPLEAHARRRLLPFVGRAEELARLERLLEAVLHGRIRFGVISAPAGVGKTRLAEEFLHRAPQRGCTVLRGYCDGELSAEPLQPFLQMLRSHWQVPSGAAAGAAQQVLDARLAELDPALAERRAELLHALAGESKDEAAARRPAELTVRALQEVFAAMARRRPLVLFVDDWHWADDATRQLLYTVRDGGGPPLLLLAAARPGAPGDVGPGATESIALAPLAEHEALATVAELLPTADPFVAGQIVRQAGGNALFIEELCHFIANAGPTAALQPPQGGPAWLESLIASRVARLSPGQRRVIDTAAVIGTLVPHRLLQELTGCAPDHPDVSALAALDLLYPAEEPGALRFKHGITRDVVYTGIGLQLRRQIHRQAAALLAAGGDERAAAQVCEALAYHWKGAGEPALAARYAAMSGDKAMAASSIDLAKSQYRAALELLDRLPDSAERYQGWRSLARRLGMATVYDPAGADLPLFERAVELARNHGDAAGLAFASYWRAYIGYALGRSRAALRHGADALRAAAEAGDARLALQVRALQGQALAACGRSAEAEALLDDTLVQMRAAQPPDGRVLAGLAFTLACRASVVADRGRLDEALAGFEQALAALPSPGHEVEGSVLCLRSNVHLWHGRWDAAAADAAAACRVAQRVRSLYLFAMGRSLQSWADWQRDGDTRALHALDEATRWLIGHDKTLFISLNHGRLAEALAASGQRAAARRQAAQALRRWRGCDPLGAAMALRALARLAAADGDRERAARCLARAERVAALRDSAHERAANARCRDELRLLA